MNRVLVFGVTDNPGGVESVILNYYRKIDKNKIQFDFLCNTEIVAYEDEIKKLGGTIYRITARSKNYKKYHEELNNFFKNNSYKYSSIWVNVCSLANIDYLKYAKKYGIKKRIIHSHNSQNMDSKIRGILHKINKIQIKRFATDFWSCSEIAGKWFYSKKILKSDKYLIINNAIDVNKFKYNETVRNEYRKLLDTEDKIVIGHIGRFHFQKNQEFLIDIFKGLTDKYDNIVLLMAGKGEDEEKIKEKVKQLDIIDKVKFLGLRNDIEKVIQAMDVFVFPSRFEGLPLILLEVQASGLPLVVAKDGITEEVKMSDEFKFMFLNDELKLWEKQIIEYIEKQKDRNKISNENISNITKKGFNIDIEASKIENYFI